MLVSSHFYRPGRTVVNVAAIVPYHTDFCAGQRFRIELWARHLRPRGVDVQFLAFSTPHLTDVLHQQGQTLQKAGAMMRCYAEQLFRVARHARPDVVFIYREAALIGPAVIERLSKRWKVPIVYDIDEPIFMPYVSPHSGRLNVLKFFGKADSLIEMSDRVLVVNDAIAEYASKKARKVTIVPMAVDTDRYQPGKTPVPDRPLRLGWMGTRTSQRNLQEIAGALARLKTSHGSVLRVVADDPIELGGVDVEFLPWSFDIEVPRLQECQIGVVPVQPDTWSKWKFYFKLIQLMALGLPVVASPIGSNREIIQDGVNGFFASTEEEWYDRLRRLADDAELRRTMGQAARATVLARFDLRTQIDEVEGILKECA